MALLSRTDAELYYELSGDGRPVLFIQGIGVAGEGWRPQVSALSARWQTLLFDNRGLGRSVPCRGPITVEAMAGDARALLDAAGWASAHVVGHSMGGVIAQQLALDAPDRVRSLALLCTFARGADGARLTPSILWMSLRTRVGSRRMRRRAFLEMIWSKADLRVADQDALAAQVAALVGRDLADSPPILLRQLKALGRHNVFNRLGTLANLPTLVLSAEHDPIARPESGRALAAAIPGAHFEPLPAASHGVPIQHAAEINTRLERFWEAAEPGRSSHAAP
ncbi:MAG: 3-oxoadipate enol-lactonase [Chthoniobacter sp.]|jgi:pimeloyl-ACP methyl ester carboxylesterase|nr:3-oxoadipate enol-lactonase [Chthoniobacter sp.]